MSESDKLNAFLDKALHVYGNDDTKVLTKIDEEIMKRIDKIVVLIFGKNLGK